MNVEASSQVELSIVVPFYNEATIVEVFFLRLTPVLERITHSYEIICVNDGSSDATLDKLRQKANADPHIRVIDFSRNFGKESAVSAGLAHSRGAAAVLIDADLQDPPELIESFYKKWKQGFDVVYGTRKERRYDSLPKRITARAFYRMFNWMNSIKLPPDAGDFRLLSRQVIDAINCLPERRRFMKGIYSWVGFRQTEIEYERAARSGGTSSWTYWKLWNFALDGLSSFTTFPLRVWTYVGLATLLLSLALLAMFFIVYLGSTRNPPGFYWIVTLILFFGSMQMVSIGVMGEYIGRTLEETKMRPLYIIREKIGFESRTETT